MNNNTYKKTGIASTKSFFKEIFFSKNNHRSTQDMPDDTDGDSVG